MHARPGFYFNHARQAWFLFWPCMPSLVYAVLEIKARAVGALSKHSISSSPTNSYIITKVTSYFSQQFYKSVTNDNTQSTKLRLVFYNTSVPEKDKMQYKITEKCLT